MLPFPAAENNKMLLKNASAKLTAVAEAFFYFINTVSK